MFEVRSVIIEYWISLVILKRAKVSLFEKRKYQTTVKIDCSFVIT